MRNKIILAVILLLGLFLRIYDLNGESLWVDEGISIKTAHLSMPQLIRDRASHFHTPLYFIMLHYWIKLFGAGEFSARFLSVVFGFLALLMAYKLGRLIFDKKAGIMASLLLSVSTFHIYHSQEARMYSLLTLLTLCSFFFFIRMLKEKSFIVSAGYIIASFLLIYTHYTGLAIIAAQNIYVVAALLFFRRKINLKFGFKKWLFLQSALVMLIAPWIKIVLFETDINSFLYRMLGGQEHIFDFPARKISTIAVFFYNWASGSIPLLCLFLSLSFFSIVRFEKDKNRIYMLLAWLFIPVILIFFLLATNNCWPKYTIAASLAFYFLAAKGLSSISRGYVKKIVIGAIITFSMFNIYHYNTRACNQQWRDAVNYIDTHIKPDDLLLFLDPRLEYVFDYYSKKTDSVKKEFFKENTDIKNYARVWLIQGKPGMFVEDTTEKVFGDLYKARVHRKYSGMDIMTQTLEVYLFEKSQQ